MLDFAVKLTETPTKIEETDRAALRRRLLRSRYLGHRLDGGVFQHVEPGSGSRRYATERGVSWDGAVRFQTGAAVILLGEFSLDVEIIQVFEFLTGS
jgi:hypothetical protein